LKDKIMQHLHLIYAPDMIFKAKAEPVTTIDDNIRLLAGQMHQVMQQNHGIGLGANMVGVLKRIVVIDMHIEEDGIEHHKKLTLINPLIVEKSVEKQNFEEASLSFPGISAHVPRHTHIKVQYIDENAQEQEVEAKGFFSCVLQHEIDYLDGKTFLDYQSRLDRQILLKKTQKYQKNLKKEPCGHGCVH
jgi:peptide deformylase